MTSIFLNSEFRTLGNITVGNIKVDVWEEKYDISFKDQSIFF